MAISNLANYYGTQYTICTVCFLIKVVANKDFEHPRKW